MVETRGGRRFAIFFFVAAFLVLLLGRWVRPVDNVAVTAAAPFVAVVSGVAGSVGDTVAGITQGPSLYNENKHLRQEVGLLLTKNMQYQDQLRDDKFLRTMTKFDQVNDHFDFLTARVIALAPDPMSPYLFINKGRRDGLRTNMTVVDPNGYFVGSLSEVLGNSSKVLPMVNPSSSVGAVDAGTHASGMVDGEYGNRTQLDWVATRATLHAGDFVVTSGLMNMYPRDIILGQITKVHRANVSPFQMATLRPMADMQNLELVQVIRNFTPSVPAVVPKH